MDDRKLFERWFVKPLRILASIPSGDGAFIALATSCFLYERYVKAIAFEETGRRFDKKLSPELRNTQLAQDFDIEEDAAAAFWIVMRDGLLHCGMPKLTKGTKSMPKWRFAHDYPQAITLSQHPNGDWWLEVQPWRFMETVIELCQDNIDLIAGARGFPWASVED
jgi:hypothetical protein